MAKTKKIPNLNDMLKLIYNFMDDKYNSTDITYFDLETQLKELLDKKVSEVNNPEFTRLITLFKKNALTYKNDAAGMVPLDSTHEGVETLQSTYFGQLRMVFQNGSN